MIANISRVSGIAPDDLLRLDSRMFEAVEAEAEVAPEPEPVKPAKKGFFGKGKKGS